MAKFNPSAQLRQVLAERANGRCEYCQCPEAFSPQVFSVEHIIAKSRGGSDEPDNLAFSCQGCNGFKSNKIEAPDPATGLITPLFHPRLHRWNDHFTWDEEGRYIVALTPVGRVTVAVLRLNRPYVLNLRKLLVLGGEHPPV
ncbi:MAG TPA: HNH endonuclease [Saprospiraceae bacterium]|nr:HNH endonuclease [Saprospiraceae bacterium]